MFFVFLSKFGFLIPIYSTSKTLSDYKYQYFSKILKSAPHKKIDQFHIDPKAGVRIIAHTSIHM